MADDFTRETIEAELALVSTRAQSGWATCVKQALEDGALIAEGFVYHDVKERTCGCFYGHAAELEWNRASALADDIRDTLPGNHRGGTPIELLLFTAREGRVLEPLPADHPSIVLLMECLDPYIRSEEEIV